MYNFFMKFSKKIILAVFLTLFSASCAQKPDERSPEGPETYQPADYPELWCDYIYLVDADNDQVLLDIGSEERMYPASMTKVMTSIIAIEKIPDPEEVTIEFTEEMMEGLVEAQANRAGFVVGDKPTALDHIYGDLLPSGADCSRALAFYIAGDEESFVELMNQKAKELGMNDTHFVNTSGLHEDDHYTTCRDMMKLYRYCMENETFMEIIQTQVHKSIPVAHYRNGLGMTNFVLMYINQENPKYDQNYMIDGFVGGKSGYTIEGQYTLVSNAVVNGRNLVLVNAHGYNEPHYPASIEDAANLYNWFRDHYEIRTAVQEGEEFGSVRVRNCREREVKVKAADTITLNLPKGDNTHVYVELAESLEAPVSAGDKAGTVSVYAYDQKVAETDLIVEESREKTFLGTLDTVLIDLSNGNIWVVSLFLLGILTIIVCVLLILAIRRSVILKKKRKARRESRKTSDQEPMA